MYLLLFMCMFRKFTFLLVECNEGFGVEFFNRDFILKGFLVILVFIRCCEFDMNYFLFWLNL